MAESQVIVRCPSSSSPPPNCAICLGGFSNKCFSDSCMHQFCFKCLLEWSKIKAECPLCKQPFTRIIHNVKSNEEYDEHLVEIRPTEQVHIIDDEEFQFLPLAHAQQAARNHFHFRTTFTVDTHVQHAIQQMLLAHPQISVNASGYSPTRYNYHRRRRENVTTTSFRRSIYRRNLWVIAPPDVTGRYRDVSPQFFRNFPSARSKLSSWLIRELSALLFDNSWLVMRLVDIIMDHLLVHHICSRAFRNLLFEYLDNKTDHFIHEFYNFMRSPFDMIGYDRHVMYSERPEPSSVVTLPDDGSDSGHDSDVIIVGSTNRDEPVVIDLVNTDSDEPELVFQEVPSPIPIPDNSPEPEREVRTPILPLKLRLKHKRRTKEEKKEKRYRKRSKRYRSSSTSSSSSSSISNSSDSSWTTSERHKRKKKLRKVKRRQHNSENEDASENNCASQSESTSKKVKLRRQKSSKRKNNASSITKEELKTEEAPSPIDVLNLPSCSKYNQEEFESTNSHLRERENNITDLPTCSRYTYTPPLPNNVVNKTDSTDDEYLPEVSVKREIKSEPHGNGRESKHSERLRNIVIKKEKFNTWSAYQCCYDSSSDSN